MSKHKWNFRDVSLGIKKFRQFLLGRKHTLQVRFPPLIASRTIQAPDIPRGIVTNYSDHYYLKRNAMSSVKPPVIAPVAEGPPLNQDPTKKSQPGGISPDAVCFHSAPTPGPSWCWDGHHYYECVPDTLRSEPNAK